jgi:hypothetical protein
MNKNIMLLMAATGLSACVTINIYFPAAAAEKAADKIIEEVWQLKDAQTKPGEPTPKGSPDSAPDGKPAETKPAETK